MENRKEKVFEIIRDLIDAFPETQESVFLILIKILIKRNYKDEDIAQMVEKTIDNVKRTKLTVADVIQYANEKPKEVYVVK